MKPSILFVFLSSLLMFHASAQERQWFRVSLYHLNSEDAEALFDKTFAEAVLPALERQGIAPVGVFAPVHLEKDKEKPLSRQRCVITPLSSPDQLVSISEKMGQDAEFMEKAAAYLGVGKDAAVFSRVESSLLYAFEGMPRLVVPKKETDSARLFELRVYESHSEMKGKLKVQMFNEGEMGIFKEAGVQSVFFGEAVIGKNLPNLTYMTVYNDEAHRGEVWKKFSAHPKWKEMSKMELYKDTVSKIIAQHMKPLPYSVIQ